MIRFRYFVVVVAVIAALALPATGAEGGTLDKMRCGEVLKIFEDEEREPYGATIGIFHFAIPHWVQGYIAGFLGGVSRFDSEIAKALVDRFKRQELSAGVIQARIKSYCHSNPNKTVFDAALNIVMPIFEEVLKDREAYLQSRVNPR